MPTHSNPDSLNLSSTAREDESFSEVVRLIAASREKALQAVNTALIDLYWQVGATISRKMEAAEWGDGVVDRLAQFIGRTEPGLRGFTRRNLFRMKQFYEAYREDPIVSPLVAQLPWSHHLIILGQSKRPEEREFYVRLAIRERWSKRELERQFKTALFERAVLSPPKVSPLVAQMYPDALSVFRDAYNVEFLGLPSVHAEADLHRGLLDKLKDFLIELGRDFCFVGSEYPLFAGNEHHVAADYLTQGAFGKEGLRKAVEMRDLLVVLRSELIHGEKALVCIEAEMPCIVVCEIPGIA
jgi:predicted nuclease of restriction endonuclease-like (RecB) superfamily